MTTEQIDAVDDMWRREHALDRKEDPSKSDLTSLAVTVEIPWPRNFQSDEDIEDVRLAMLSAGLAAAAQLVDRHRRPTALGASR